MALRNSLRSRRLGMVGVLIALVLGVYGSRAVFAAPTPDVRVSISDGVTTVAPGDEVSYTLVISEVGGVGTTNVDVQVVLPSEVTFVEASDGGAESGGTVDWQLATLNANQTVRRYVTLKFNTGLAAGSAVTLTAKVSSADDTSVFQATDTDTIQNMTPVANNSSVATDEDTAIDIDLAALGSDANGDALVAVNLGAVAHGTLQNLGNGTVRYTPTANYNGPDSFTYKLSDGTATSNQSTITITVRPVNDPPVVTGPATVTVNEDSPPYNQTWASALNAGPLETTQSFTVTTSVDKPALFSIAPQVADDGTLTFTPAPDANGTAKVTVEADDGEYKTSFTFDLTILPVNDAPSFTPGSNVQVDEDSGVYSQLWATGMSVGPTDEDMQGYSFTLNATIRALFRVQPAIDGNGRLSFTPAPNAFGSTSVAVVMSDWGDTANGGVNVSAQHTFTITIAPVNDNPTASDDRFTVARGASVSFSTSDLLANDSDIDGDTLSVQSVNTAAAQFGTATFMNGTITYTPGPSFTNGDSFGYTISDGKGGTATATIVIERPQTTRIYMPMVGNTGTTTPAPTPTPGPVLTPDLTGSIAITPGGTSFAGNQAVTITATITNQGTAAASGGFWVDLYFNPSQAPTAANMPWNELCTLDPCQGIAWYVTQTVNPGQTITLTSTSGSYSSGQTIWSGSLTPGTTDIYLYIDSWNPGVSVGAIAESSETNNQAAIHSLTVSGLSSQTLTNQPNARDLPPRPARPATTN